MNWKILQVKAELEDLVLKSYAKPQVVFKHSIRCGISSVAKSRLETDWNFSEVEIDFHLLDLINYRQISNLVEELFNVQHQSPQILLIIGGKAIYDTSHLEISAISLKNALEN